MAEPLTIAGVLAATAVHSYYHIVGGEAHHGVEKLVELWRETALDEHGRPHNHDLQHASLESLRGTLQVLALEIAGRIDPKKSWLKRARERLERFADGLPGGALLNEELLLGGQTMEEDWMRAFAAAVRSERLAELHDALRLDDAQVAQCFRDGQAGAALGPVLAPQVLAWARREVRVGSEHSDFESLVTSGWELTRKGGHGAAGAVPPRFTLAQAYCLFFREHLKANAKVFRIFTADTLGAIVARLDGLGGEASTEMKALRAEVARLAATPTRVDFAAFEAWLTPQLAGLRELLAGVQPPLEALARGQDELKRQQGELLAAIAALGAEQWRGSPDAAPALAGLKAHLVQLEHKVDYLIGGLPLVRFQLPDPPWDELQLLHAKHRTVDVLGRATDLDALSRWLESAEPISARLLVGGAGTGKTRLAFELLLRTAAELPRWQAGLLGGDDLRRLVEKTHTPDFNWAAPTLLVVDYAQTLAGSLRALCRALTHQRRAGRPPLRLLLLERVPGDWFDDLLREEDAGAPCAVRALFQPPEPVKLTPLPEGALRRQVLAATLEKAAQLASQAAPAMPAVGHAEFERSLARELFNQPLNLMLAALVAGDIGVLPALRRERIDLAEMLAGKELRRIERFARDPRSEAQKRALRHLAACATMERGFTSQELDRAVAEELAALQLVWPEGPGDLAVQLRAALGGGDLPVAPIEPDFVGEAVVLTTLAQPDGNGAGRWGGWCRVVERCARRDARATPGTLLHAFQNFGHAARHGESLLAAADALIRTGVADEDPALLVGIESGLAIIPTSTALRSRAAEVTRHQYARLVAMVAAGRGELRAEVARVANNLGIRLSDMGRRAEALGPAEEAVKIRRELAETNPDAFRPDLAMSLNNLATMLSDVGRRAEALGPAEEAVKIRRELAETNPDAFRPNLAASLNNLATRLSQVGRRAEALGSAEEAVKIYRELAETNPDAFRPDLAMSLNNFATRLSEVGRRAEALGPAEEAVKIYRELAETNPDAFRPNLATSLGAMSQMLAGLQRHGDAAAALAEGMQTLQPAFKALPQAFAPLMGALVQFYIKAAEAAKFEPDMDVLGPVVTVFERLKKQAPDEPNRE